MMVCRLRQVSNIDPKFHQVEIFRPTGNRLNSRRVCWLGIFVVDLQRWFFGPQVSSEQEL